MTRPEDLAKDAGLSLRTVYRRALALGLSLPYKFTASEVKRIVFYKGGKK